MWESGTEQRMKWQYCRKKGLPVCTVVGKRISPRLMWVELKVKGENLVFVSAYGEGKEKGKTKN